MRTRLLILTGAVVAAALIPGSALATSGSDMTRARQGTAAYHNLDKAKAAGYSQFTDAAGIACIDKPGTGGMGIHYLKGSLAGDAVVDPANPELLVYAPAPDGKLRLAALEYVIFQSAWTGAGHAADVPPTLFGQDFELVKDETYAPDYTQNRYHLPAFWELHAWVWENNRDGMFADWNPAVVCP